MASRRPRMRTASISTVETVQGTHSFKITQYSLHKQISTDKCFCSGIFAVGGHNWRILYDSEGQDARSEYVSVFLELIGELVQVTASFRFRMVNPVTGVSSMSNSFSPLVFNRENPTHGFTSFVRKNELEFSTKYVQDGCLVIECDVTVIKEIQVKEIAVTSDFYIHVPPSDLSNDLRRLLDSEEEADVTFKVKGEVFCAHKIVLAMRSPVFKAELYGPMRNKETESKTVEGIDPIVFKALLDFIYTDSFPVMEDLNFDEQEDMVKHLLVAADTYGMERLKLICENILCKRIDVESVAYTLALAGQHHCNKLKNACIEFIICQKRMDVVIASLGYEHLKTACPDVTVELWEKAAKSSMA
ncbi:hypothetical protein HU200_037626 [Digitaria exilis]|uniref:Speckle-type POZ protein n=1 Tax=Digitaria exilis TaxID=1010633 RepID=A0A835BQG4_9POAL|nr:hypothetical protein HU200_037626 [Digitaria exilis]